jgi:hypothetical protein
VARAASHTMDYSNGKPMEMELTTLAELGKTAGEAWVQAQERAELLEKTKDAYLAELKCSANSGKISDAQLTTYALATPQFQQHIRGMVAARAKANLAKIQVTYYERMWESKRSEMSLVRTQIERGVYKQGG